MITISLPADHNQLPCVGLMIQDPSLRQTVLTTLIQSGFTCWEASGFEDLSKRIPLVQTDVVLYEVTAPAQLHIDELRQLSNQHSVGLIAIPAEQSHDAGKSCLQAGADHYLLKPLDHELLVVMLQALWRRLSTPSASAPAPTPIADSRWELDEVRNCLIIDRNTQVGLSHQEFEFMAAVMQKPNAPIKMAELHQVMFPDFEEVNSHRLSVLLNRLRKKVKAKGHRLPIRSLYGRGLVYIQD